MSMCALRGKGLAAVALAGTLLPLALAAAPAPADKPAGTTAEKVRRQLDSLINLDLDQQPLHLAISQLQELTHINFVLDRFTLGQMNIDPDQATVTLRLKDVRVRSALRTLLTPFNLSYAIVGDTVVISSDDMVTFRQLRQRISVDLDKVEFAKALRQLGRETATNLIMDMRVTKEAQQPVTLQMDDVPLETAVRLMAEMVGLKPVRVGNALFVTTKANATELRADPDLTPVPQPGNPGEKVIVAPGGAVITPAAPAPAAPAKPAETEEADKSAPKKVVKPDDEEKPAKAPDKPADKTEKPADKPAEKRDKP
jgi:hypothetical protein